MIPVVSAVCLEPEGPIVRSVYKMVLTKENLQRFWQEARKFRTVFSKEATQDYRKFCELFVSGQSTETLTAHGLFWVIDDFVGIYYMTDISDSDAQVHYTFFDRRHLGREELTKQMLQYVFERFGFRRLSVQVPTYSSPHTFRFVKSLGFKDEGRKRKVVQYKDDWYDVVCFGLLKEEALNGQSV